MRILNVVSMGAPKVADQSAVTLTRWVLAEGPGEGGRRVRRLIGRPVQRPQGVRISSALVSWDPSTLRCVTESGRAYELSGGDEDEVDGDFTAEAAVVAALHGCEDVTARVLAAGTWQVHDA